LKKQLQQVNLINNPRNLPFPEKKKKKKTGHPSWNAYSAMKLSGNNQESNSCISCMLCTAVLQSPDLASGEN
jgi:hypothetical protein